MAAWQVGDGPRARLQIAGGHVLLVQGAPAGLVIVVAAGAQFLASALDLDDQAVVHVVGMAVLVQSLRGLAVVVLAQQQVALAVPQVAHVQQGLGVGGLAQGSRLVGRRFGCRLRGSCCSGLCLGLHGLGRMGRGQA